MQKVIERSIKLLQKQNYSRIVQLQLLGGIVCRSGVSVWSTFGKSFQATKGDIKCDKISRSKKSKQKLTLKQKATIRQGKIQHFN